MSGKNDGRFDDLVLRIESRVGMSPGIIDFNVLGLRYNISLGLKRALVADLGHNAFDTQRKAFQGLKLLAQCLAELGRADKPRLDADTIYIFADWLDASSRGSSAQAMLNNVRRLLMWCQRNAPNVIAHGATFAVHRIREFSTKPRTVVNEQGLKEILKACYREIDATEKELARGQKLINGQITEKDDENPSILIRELLELGAGQLPMQKVLWRSGHAYARRVQELGIRQRVSGPRTVPVAPALLQKR